MVARIGEKRLVQASMSATLPPFCNSVRNWVQGLLCPWGPKKRGEMLEGTQSVQMSHVALSLVLPGSIR